MVHLSVPGVGHRQVGKDRGSHGDEGGIHSEECVLDVACLGGAQHPDGPLEVAVRAAGGVLLRSPDGEPGAQPRGRGSIAGGGREREPQLPEVRRTNRVQS